MHPNCGSGDGSDIGRVTPEHEVHNAPYRVHVVIDTCERCIVSAQ